jgi:hypothetical protein
LDRLTLASRRTSGRTVAILDKGNEIEREMIPDLWIQIERALFWDTEKKENTSLLSLVRAVVLTPRIVRRRTVEARKELVDKKNQMALL